ncbi:uncharacterized protein [Montipora capricornis]|uniref:uncharacterized protein isoform X1 n=2 Tax=Montipora capricornis TaxID=246305 RepID=UPI0035F20F4C
MVQFLIQNVKTIFKLWLSAVTLVFLYYQYISNNSDELVFISGMTKDVNEFQENWCRIRHARVDTDSVLKPCSYNTSWTGNSSDYLLRTDATKSFISLWDVRPAGQFSRFSIQTKTTDGEIKRIGGDWWRVLLRGPATVSPSMFDLGNGTYEFLFLAMDPGVYKLDITLDYSLCDGYRDPPRNWFILGNSQGKMQKDGTLGENRAKDDFLLQPFQSGKLFMIDIPMPTNTGAFLINFLSDRSHVASKLDLSCGIKCSFMWDGFGRWIGRNWKPYLKEIPTHSQEKKSDMSVKRRLRALWIYGDSQAERLHLSILDGPLCREIFQSCNLSKLWVYPYKGQRPPWDNKDFNDQIVVEDLRRILEQPEMDENSVLILNLGLHYMESLSFREYQRLLNKVLNLLKERDGGSGQLKYNTRVIWKTSTSLSKEKDTGDQLKSDRRRFLTLPRVKLYNSYATSLMCKASLEVLDVYPFTRSYPEGTGGPEVAYYKDHDIVHFKFHVMKALDRFIEDYLLGKVLFPIDVTNYMFQ